jgi:hypothetical protein
MRTVSFFNGTADVLAPEGGGMAAVFDVGGGSSSLMEEGDGSGKSGGGHLFSGFDLPASMSFSPECAILSD